MMRARAQTLTYFTYILGTLNDHVQNVFKTRASREMGCRFLPELLELDLLPTAPINCLNRCPFPYVNSQKFGVYCVCCPPGGKYVFTKSPQKPLL